MRESINIKSSAIFQVLIRSKTHSNAHQTVFTKENDKYQWFVLEQKSQCEVEVRQTDSHGTRQVKVSKTYSFPKSHVSYRKPRAVNIEQRERARQMMIAKNRVKKD